MKSAKISNSNFRKDKKKNINTLYVDSEYFNNLVDDVIPAENQRFDGLINLSRAMTHYATKTISVATTISVKASPAPAIGGYAEATLIGDGYTSPTFGIEWVATPGSETYDFTLNAINKVGFYFDGTYYFYTITVII